MSDVQEEAVQEPAEQNATPSFVDIITKGDDEEIEQDIDRRIESLNNLADRQASMRKINDQDPDRPVTTVLHSNYVEISVGGLKKSISLMDYKNILDNMLSQNMEKKLQYKSLPYGCYLLGESLTDMQIACYYAEHIGQISHGTKKYTIPFPNTIVSFNLKRDKGFWRVTSTKYFCTTRKVTQLPENSLITAQDRSRGIWTMPFPNFYEDGNMCYGGNTMPVLYNDNLRGLDYFYQVIFLSPFNNDLGIRNVQHRPDVSGWFSELSKLKEFPYEKLVEYTPNIAQL